MGLLYRVGCTIKRALHKKTTKKLRKRCIDYTNIKLYTYFGIGLCDHLLEHCRLYLCVCNIMDRASEPR